MLLWLVGAIAIRLAGQHLLRLNLLLLYLLSFAAMIILVPRIFGGMGLEKDVWPKAVTLLMLPTLLLDAFSCAFFTTVYPNVNPAAAGAFGGWMLIFCAGAAVGAWAHQWRAGGSPAGPPPARRRCSAAPARPPTDQPPRPAARR